jgi:hypothetical protein
VYLKENPENPSLNVSIAGRSAYLWDVNEADRFVKLAHEFPDLLTHEEQILWNLVRRTTLLWRKTNVKFSDDPTWLPLETHFHFELLREHWDTFKAVAKDEADPSTLPGWSEPDPEPES